MKEQRIRPKNSFRDGETPEFRVMRNWVWVGSDEKAGFTRLTPREMRKLRDALNEALGDA